MARDYSPEVKAQVMAALLEGQSIRQVADATGVPRGTIGHWAKEAKAVVPTVSDTKKDEIGDLLIALLIAKIESLTALTQHTADKVWLKGQDASAVAMLLGVSDDKLVRMLEKFENARSEPEPATN